MKQTETDMIENTIHDLENQGRFALEKTYPHHGNTTVYDHSVHVARISLQMADLLHLDVNDSALVRGALLHDYFLYDWHEGKNRPRWHGITHPRTALKNAREDFVLCKKEEDIIARHMFPLTRQMPQYKESWIVCIADKGCAAAELISPLFIKKQRKADAQHG